MFMFCSICQARCWPNRPLEEGAVTLTFPAELSATSYQDLADHLELFLRKAKRKADRMIADNGPDDEAAK